MPLKLEISGKFNDGKLTIINRNQFESLSKNLNCEVDILITQRKKKRSSPQNKYYWACVVAEIQTCLNESQGEWHNAETVHEFLKGKFNSKDIINKKTGEVVSIPQSTTELTTLQFEEYLDKIRAWADQFFDCVIALRNEQKEMSL